MTTIRLKDILSFVDQNALVAVLMTDNRVPTIVFFGKKSEIKGACPSSFPIESLMNTQIRDIKADASMNFEHSYINITILFNEEVAKWQLQKLSGRDEQE